MNANIKPVLYVVQTPAMNEAINKAHEAMSEEEKQLFFRQNQVYIPTAEEKKKIHPTGDLFMMGLQMFGNAIQFIVEQNSSRFGLEQMMITASRYQQLRQAIQRGERFRLGQMQEMICRHRDNVVQIAELIDLPADVVQAATKRWFFF